MMRVGLTAVALLTGCAALKPAIAPVTLRLQPVAIPGRAFVVERIAVAPVSARGLVGGTRYAFVATDAPAELRLANTLFWEESPTLVVQRALVEALRTRFASVAGPEIGGASDRRVIARLDRFEESGAGGNASAEVAFEAILTGRSLVTGRYCAYAPIINANPTVRARAFETAIGDAVSRFAQDAATGALSSASCINRPASSR